MDDKKSEQTTSDSGLEEVIKVTVETPQNSVCEENSQDKDDEWQTIQVKKADCVFPGEVVISNQSK